MTAVVSLDSRRQTATPAPAAPLAIATGDRILRMPAVRERVGLSAATIYRLIVRDEFPAQVPLGGKSVGWRESAINAWIASRGLGGAA